MHDGVESSFEVSEHFDWYEFSKDAKKVSGSHCDTVESVCRRIVICFHY